MKKYIEESKRTAGRAISEALPHLDVFREVLPLVDELQKQGAALHTRFENLCNGFPWDKDGTHTARYEAATDNKEVNQTIYNDAKKRNILVSLSDDTEHSDFILPSSKNYDDITISVSTNGKSPALAKKISQIKSNDLEFYASILPIIEKYRSILISESRDTKKEILNFMVSDEMLEIAKESLELYEQKIKEKI